MAAISMLKHITRSTATYNAFFVLDLRLYIVDGVGRLDLEGDGLAGEGLYEAAMAGTQAQYQQCCSISQLSARLYCPSPGQAIPSQPPGPGKGACGVGRSDDEDGTGPAMAA